jgi:hypothetical protein
MGRAVGAFLGERSHTESAREGQESSLSLGSDETLLRLESGAVDGDGLDDLTALFLGELGGELRRANLRSSVVLVIEGALSKLTSNDCHDVGGEGTSLVRANSGSIAHCLAGLQDTDKVVKLDEASGGEGESQGDGEWETLRDGHDDNGDGDDENVHELAGWEVVSTL